jgi:hypothetical protein
MNSQEALSTLKFSIQRALIGEVTTDWAAVTCSVQDKKILILLFVWGPVKPSDRQGISSVAAEVIADFPDDYTIDEDCRSLDNSSLSVLDFWAFMRAEAEPR